MFVFKSGEQGLVYLWMSGTVGLYEGGIQTDDRRIRLDRCHQMQLD